MAVPDDTITQTNDCCLLTLDEVATRLRVSATTVARLVADGELRCIRFRGTRRVQQVDFDDFITRHASPT